MTAAAAAAAATNGATSDMTSDQGSLHTIAYARMQASLVRRYDDHIVNLHDATLVYVTMFFLSRGIHQGRGGRRRERAFLTCVQLRRETSMKTDDCLSCHIHLAAKSQD